MGVKFVTEKTQQDFLLKYAAMALAAVATTGNTEIANAQENASNAVGQGVVPASSSGRLSPQDALIQRALRLEAIAVYGPPPTSKVTGPLTSQTISDSITMAGNDMGKQGSIFVAAFVQNRLFAMDSSGAWAAWNGVNADFPAYSSGSLQVTSVTFAKAMDLSGLIGTSLYVGYGLSSASSPPGTAFANMVLNGTYMMAYTIR